MNYVDEFGLDVNNKTGCKLITLVGAGGKTTTMFKLASQLKLLGKRVLVTTTTMIYMPNKNEYDAFVLSNEARCGFDKPQKSASITVLGSEITSEGKLKGLEPDFLDQICNSNSFDFILVEGDGSKRKPIKAPAEHEPVIPKCCTIVIGVIGMDSIGNPINEAVVHRVELFCKITNSRQGEPIGLNHIFRLIESPNGLFQRVDVAIRKYVLLNKFDRNIGDEEIDDIRDKIMKMNRNIQKVIINYYSKDGAEDA